MSEDGINLLFGVLTVGIWFHGDLFWVLVQKEGDGASFRTYLVAPTAASSPYVTMYGDLQVDRNIQGQEIPNDTGYRILEHGDRGELCSRNK